MALPLFVSNPPRRPLDLDLDSDELSSGVGNSSVREAASGPVLSANSGARSALAPVDAAAALPSNVRFAPGTRPRAYGATAAMNRGTTASRLRMVVGPNVAPSHARGREAIALLLWTAALFITLALASFAGDPATGTSTGSNWVGPVGEACARALVSTIGLTAWALPLETVLLGIPLVRSKPSMLTPTRFAGDLLIVLTASALVQVGWRELHAFGAYPAAGLVGELFGELSRSLFSTVGSFIVGFAILGLILIGRAAFSFIALLRFLADFGTRGALGTAAGARSVADAWRTAREIERERSEKERMLAQPRIDLEVHDDATIAVLPDEDAVTGALTAPDEAEPLLAATPVAPLETPRRRRKAAAADGEPVAMATVTSIVPRDALDDDAPQPSRRRRKGDASPENSGAAVTGDETKSRGKGRKLLQLPLPKPVGDGVVESADADAGEGKEEELDESSDLEAEGGEFDSDSDGERELDDDAPSSGVAGARAARGPKASAVGAPTIIDTSAVLAKEVIKEREKPAPRVPTAFQLPSCDFLIPMKVDPTAHVDKETLLKNAELLVKTLGDYGVSGKVEDILPGPTVTTFEVSPAAGTKVSKVASLADDLALALARKVRIVAPIPGKNRIGFELPNEKRIPVSLRDLIEDRRFQTLDAPLPVVLGRDIVGAPVYADLASMPHVIVAGATGAGKSVGLNVMLTSLLFRRSPEELRLLMIDPKVVELAPFDRIPHMLLPVVTDMKQASNALKWAVDEMERRYQLFADAGTKNISTFNNWVERVCRGEIKNPAAKVVFSKDHNGFQDAIPAEKDSDEGVAPLPEKLPFIVIVVDEFADLMMQQGKEVEAAVARLAQKARAAGMHVILATQRPSVDVITGMIKANFPTRVAYRVAQKVDSRTILDEQGAEHLLGRGDMLIKLNGTNETKRVQCPMVTEEEVQEVTDFLRAQGEPVYDENILKPRDDDGAVESEEDAEQDPLYDDAVRIVADTRRCSTSWLQRKLGLGYNRAARIVEMMERRGLVGPANGAKDREVLISPI